MRKPCSELFRLVSGFWVEFAILKLDPFKRLPGHPHLAISVPPVSINNALTLLYYTWYNITHRESAPDDCPGDECLGAPAPLASDNLNTETQLQGIVRLALGWEILEAWH